MAGLELTGRALLKTLPYVLGSTDQLPEPGPQVVPIDLSQEERSKIQPAAVSTLYTAMEEPFYRGMSIGDVQPPRDGWSMSEALNSAWEIDMASARASPQASHLATRIVNRRQLDDLSANLSEKLKGKLNEFPVASDEVLVAVDPAQLSLLTRFRALYHGAHLTYTEGQRYGIYFEDLLAQESQDDSVALMPFALIEEQPKANDGRKGYDTLITMMGNISSAHISSLFRAVSTYSDTLHGHLSERIVFWGSLEPSVAEEWTNLGGKQVDRRVARNHWRVAATSWLDAKKSVSLHDPQAWSFMD